MDFANYSGTDILQTVSVVYMAAVTVASHLVEILPTPEEIPSHRYLIFYNTLRRLARSKPWIPDHKKKATKKVTKALKKTLDTAQEKVKQIEVIGAQDDIASAKRVNRRKGKP